SHPLIGLPNSKIPFLQLCFAARILHAPSPLGRLIPGSAHPTRTYRTPDTPPGKPATKTGKKIKNSNPATPKGISQAEWLQAGERIIFDGAILVAGNRKR